ncbi:MULTISPECIES: hypothetical protein [unclassified Lysinibacillus]|uniref:hypothetical protein n=1 Tax=unclassified Lysinibacillus TaxID=2636778 RepID=UPI001F112DB5|nr:MULTISPECIES: hypothetical protein [unclassified Lysinibacillus]
MNRIVRIIGLIFSIMLLTACTSSNEKAEYVLYAGHSLAADHPFELAVFVMIVCVLIISFVPSLSLFLVK